MEECAGKSKRPWKEIGYLQEIRGSYRQYEEKQEETASCTYQIPGWKSCICRVKIQELNDRMKETQDGDCRTGSEKSNLEKEQAELQKEYEAIILKIADSGYAAMEKIWRV